MTIFPIISVRSFLNLWCMHTEGKGQFIASTMGQVSLKSRIMWPISQGAPSAAGRRQQRCALTAVEAAASASSRQWEPGSLSSPAPPSTRQNREKTELQSQHRAVRAFPQLKKPTAPFYSTGKINKTESLLIFCKQDFHSKNLDLPQNIQNQYVKTV